jgi:predicted transcriptional regulator
MNEVTTGMFDPSAIRKMSLDGNNKAIRKLLISQQGREVWQWVHDERQATTHDVMNKFKLSVQHTSGILNKLYRQGYLRRHQQTQSSGGWEWVYYP